MKIRVNHLLAVVIGRDLFSSREARTELRKEASRITDPEKRAEAFERIGAALGFRGDFRTARRAARKIKNKERQFKAVESIKKTEGSHPNLR